MDDFREHISSRYNISLKSYTDLYKWSVDNYQTFWKEFWAFSGLIHSKSFEEVVEEGKKMNEIPIWFRGSRLNYAENILDHGEESDEAVIFGDETGVKKKLTFGQLKSLVATYAEAIKKIGVKPGDRVGGLLPNGEYALAAHLACASLGVVWTCTSPDFGTTGVLERFQQIRPTLLFAVDFVQFNGKIHSQLQKIEEIVSGLSGSLKKVVLCPTAMDRERGDERIDKRNCFLQSNKNIAVDLESFLHEGDNNHPNKSSTLTYTQVSFNHPLTILYSSGTTGAPKCMVHSHGGTLIEHLKEHQLHGNLSRRDRLMYYTTTGWMMFNWMISALSTGASIVCYDGCADIRKLWSLVDDLDVTVFGTSAKWISTNESMGIVPRKEFKLSSLHTILSTGSPLSPQSFRWVYSSIKKDVLLGSITGGSDIISCFAGQNPTIPVYEGQIQCRLLGMAVESWDENGQSVMDKEGELVVTKPFPCMPIYFWDDEGMAKYRKAYFDKYPGVWAHGDYCIIDNKTGGVVMLGRSDGTLNPSGVRFGSAEIYNIVQNFRDEIADSVCVGQRSTKNIGEERVVLFLKMKEGREFTDQLKARLHTAIREQLSPRHVPAVTLPIGDIPYTLNGKKIEVAVKTILSGKEVTNKAAIANPESLELFKNIPQLQGY